MFMSVVKECGVLRRVAEKVRRRKCGRESACACMSVAESVGCLGVVWSACKRVRGESVSLEAWAWRAVRFLTATPSSVNRSTLQECTEQTNRQAHI